jgi:signal transduction histidine kinase/ligand-binding sensor domain-containing protein
VKRRGWRRRVVLRGALVACALLASRPSAFALNPALDISQYAHTSWKVRDGFVKGRIASIAQTLDGYLWLGTDFGLYRFDGVRAIPWKPPLNQSLPSDGVTQLLAARDGTLWIGTDQGLASWKNGTLSRYEGMSGFIGHSLLEDHEGTIWALRFVAQKWTLCQIHHDAHECYGQDGGAGTGALGLFEDSHDNLWVGTQTGLWRWRPGPPRFYPLPYQENGIRAFAEDDDGVLLISHADGIRRFVDGIVETRYSVPLSMRSALASRLLRDRDGGLWIGSSQGGALGHRHEGITDAFARIDGLTGDRVVALLEDREGSVWVATTDGLDRFRDAAVAPLSVSQGLSNAAVGSVFASRDGSIWVGTNDGLNRWTHDEVRVYREGPAAAAGSGLRDSRTVHEVAGRGLPARWVYSVFQDRRDRVWFSTPRGVGYLENDRFTPVSGLPGGLTRAIVEDNRGALWIANPYVGLFRVSADAAHVEQIPLATLRQTGPLSALVADPSHGGLWVGFFDGGVVHFAEGRILAAYGAADGLAKGHVSALYSGRNGALWVATEHGLSRLENGRLSTLTGRNGLPCDAVNWAVEDDTHSLWLGMPCGLVRISRDELDAWAAADARREKSADAPQRIRATVFDDADGVRIPKTAGYYGAPAVTASDGKLWFLSVDGLSVVDPRHLPLNPLPPQVHIERVVADRQTYAVEARADGPVALPALTRDLQIDYTALSLVAPEKNQFRIKLEGRDRDWLDVGTRRQAFYNDLPPRRYRFRVMASNNNDVWNEAGAALDLTIAPAYYQTRSFVASVAVVTLLLLGGVVHLRIRYVAQQFTQRLDERVNERTRIARDLHDTLLQSFHGLLFRFQAATNRLPDSDVKQQFVRAIDQAAQAISEGRDAVQNLRLSTSVTNDLAEALGALGQELTADHANGSPAVIQVQIEGASRELHPVVRDDVYRIVGEAMRNAFRHAGARRIAVRIQYGAAQLRVDIQDDGNGIDPTVLAEHRPGHFGLPGMRERAELIGGQLEVWTRVGVGTRVSVVVPPAAAYAPARVSGLARLFATKSGTHS